MKQYNIYGGIGYSEYLYTSLYDNEENAEVDAWITASHIANAYPKVKGRLSYEVILTSEDTIEDLILGYIIDGSIS